MRRRSNEQGASQGKFKGLADGRSEQVAHFLAQSGSEGSEEFRGNRPGERAAVELKVVQQLPVHPSRRVLARFVGGG